MQWIGVERFAVMQLIAKRVVSDEPKAPHRQRDESENFQSEEGRRFGFLEAAGTDPGVADILPSVIGAS
jgi:hypothetical protein